MFGLPPALMMLSVSGGAVGLAVCVLMGVISVSLIVFISLTIGLWAWFWKHVREDCHYDRVLMQTPRFWAGKQQRTLLAGAGGR
tara:strand:- start:401 stop:652 length:252 start_codon:yes stop_codon:yes gene_type:complete